MTDHIATYKLIGELYTTQESVNHRAKEFCRGDIYVSTSESFNSILERAKQGVFKIVMQTKAALTIL